MNSKLLQAFAQAVSAFNSADYTGSLGPLLHPDVEMNEVDDPTQPPHSGKPNVLDYLNTKQGSKKPQFFYVDPLDPRVIGPFEGPPDTDHKPNTKHGQISGVGKYQDISIAAPGQDVTDPFLVRYDFLFRKEAGSWLLVMAVATPMEPVPTSAT